MMNNATPGGAPHGGLITSLCWYAGNQSRRASQNLMVPLNLVILMNHSIIEAALRRGALVNNPSNTLKKFSQCQLSYRHKGLCCLPIFGKKGF
jgi:hypothetical protein